MKKVSLITISLALLVTFFFNTSLFGDQRTVPVDLIIALDKSLSMDNKIEAVKQFVSNYLIKDILLVNDYFLVIEFYEKADVAAAGYINTEADKEMLIKKISEIKADGKWTDIGNAFDRLRDELAERLNNGRNKVFLFISDGLNDPPRASKYYSPDHKLKHEYVEKLEKYLDEGNWKVQLLDIGNNIELKSLADQLKGDVRKFKTDGSENKFEVVGTMDINSDTVKELKVSSDGRGKLQFTVKSQRFTKPQTLVIDSVKLTNGTNTVENILTKPYEATIPENGETQLTIPVMLGKGQKSGNTQASLAFSFKSQEHFNDTLNIKLKVNTLLEDMPWLIPAIIIAALLLIILIVFIIRKIIQSNALRFRMIVEEMPLPRGRDMFKLVGRNLFLIESMDLVRITEKLSTRCIAKLYARGSDLKITVLKEKAFPELKKMPDSLLGHTIIVNTESGRKYHVKFEEV